MKQSTFTLKQLCVMLAFLVSFGSFAQKKLPKNIIEANYTLGLHKKFYSISYERCFKDNAVQLTYGQSEKAGSNTNTLYDGWTWGLNYSYLNEVSYRLHHLGMFKYSRYIPLKIAKRLLYPGLYASCDARYLYLNAHVTTTDPKCAQYTRGCEWEDNFSLISIGPHVGLKTRITKVLVIHVSSAFPFYFPLERNAENYMGDFEKSKDTPYLGGALEFSMGAGVSF